MVVCSELWQGALPPRDFGCGATAAALFQALHGKDCAGV